MHDAKDLLHAHAKQVEKTMFFQMVDLFKLEIDLIFCDSTTDSFSLDYEDDPEHQPNATFFCTFGHAKEWYWAPQVFVALAFTRESIPVRSWVLPGKTANVSMVEKVRVDLQGVEPWPRHDCGRFGDEP
jgi:hypothetical protein